MAVGRMMVAMALLAGVFALATVTDGVTSHGAAVQVADSGTPSPQGTPTPTHHGLV